MSKVFYKQVEHYTDKFKSNYKALNKIDINRIARDSGVSDLKVELEKNSDAFKNLVLKVASIISIGRVSCVVYAAVVARIANDLGLDYTVYAGFCVRSDYPSLEKDLAYFNKKKAEGDEHPLLATHVYTTINGVDYEYFNSDTSGINHIDVVKIA